MKTASREQTSLKRWTKNGQSFEKIFDVAWAGDRTPDKWTGRVPAIQSTVDMEKATYTNSVVPRLLTPLLGIKSSNKIRLRPQVPLARRFRC